MNRRVLVLLLSLAPCAVLALGLDHPHWFGLGAGSSVGKKTRAVGVFTAGRLWAEQFGTGGMLVYPLESVDFGETKVTAAATVDAFFFRGRSHLAALIGATDAEGSDAMRFSAGLRFDGNVPLTRYLVFSASGSPLWIDNTPSPFQTVLHGELQFRY